MKQALVIGGFHKFVMGTFRDNLNLFGIDVGWHVSQNGGGSYTGIPQNCEAVLVLSDNVGHSMALKAFAEGKAKGLPCAYAHQKWARAEGSLRMAGVIPPVQSKDSQTPAIDDDVIKAAAIQYILEVQREGTQRIPNFEEIEMALQRAIGSFVFLSKTWAKEV
ncbi:MAG: hypothetical protein WC824_15265, partial [Bacteroidota bacterium]